MCKKELDQVVVKINELKSKLAEIEEIKSNIVDINSKIQSIGYNKINLTNSISFIESAISRCESQIIDLNESKKRDTVSSSNLTARDEILSVISKLQNDLSETMTEIDDLGYTIKMFSDEGIKAMVLRKFLPVLNKLINYYLKTFNMQIDFTITEDYDYLMKSSAGTAQSFEGLSGGQQQRINLSILFAQNDLIKLIGNFKINILFLDEYLDGAVDIDGLNDTFKILKNISIRDNKAITIVSHRLNENILRQFDNFYFVEKTDDFFSEIRESNVDEIREMLRD